MRDQIIIIKFEGNLMAVTNIRGYGPKRANVTRFVFIPSEEKFQRKKKNDFLQLEGHKTNFLINLLSSSFHHG